MSEPLDWRIPLEAEDWQCDWESSRRFQIRYWASLPLRAKLEAIEEMNDLAEHFAASRASRAAASARENTEPSSVVCEDSPSQPPVSAQNKTPPHP